MKYLLDSNILSDLVRHPQGAIANKIARVGEDNVATSIIVSAEMRFGAMKKRSPQLMQRLEGILAHLSVLSFEPPADAAYAQIRARLEVAGTPIGANDMLIAAHALASGFILVTDNEREFRRVRGLKIENWLRGA